MKKYLLWVMSVLTLFTLAACSSKDKNKEETKDPDIGDTGDKDTDKDKDKDKGEVTQKGDITITTCLGTSESAVVEWNNVDSATDYNVYYRKNGTETFVKADKELIRNTASNKLRVDLLGLAGRENYEIKVVPVYSTGEKADGASFCEVKTIKYDRSGYAHFNREEGVGAYNNDGTLKDNAIVVYVTNENKDKIVVEGSNCKKPGLGWLLNNNLYGSPGPGKDKNGNPVDKDLDPTTNWYDTGIAKVTQTNPVVIRLIGKVESPEGTTIYNSIENGGSVGDNGHMARMKNAKNVTIEGVGTDAQIYGWGIHFMRATGGIDGGYSFETRNLTFDKYPEDALGMEGIQDGNTLTAPVSNCWVHDCTFMPGYANPTAESDKAEGDGSCDFKRGEYYTLSYCKFVGAHKTNLIGSSDTAIQYNITMHHNYWQDCGSRIPLSRKANIHMYNNYFEVTDNCQNEISYAQNTRAEAFIYSEYNFFQACKNASRVDAGAIKSFNDVKYSCYEDDGSIVASTREQKVSSGNKYENFDSNDELFYYDKVEKKSKVDRLTSAAKAKAECIALSGVEKYEIDYEKSKIYDTEPTVLSESVNITTSTKIAKGTKIIFTISTDATFTMASSGKVCAVLVNIYGENMLTGTGSVDLEPGTYVIEASQARGASKGSSQAKDTNVDSYSIVFDGGAAKEARIKSANDAIANLPTTIKYDEETLNLIKTARTAYNALRDEEEALVDATKLVAADAEYTSLGKAYVEDLISKIGTVTMESGSVISNARTAYNDLIRFNSGVSVSNYSVLIEAEKAFEKFTVDYVISKINAIGKVTLNSKEDIDLAREEYIKLNEDQREEVTNYSVLQAAEKEYEKLYNIATINDLIANVDLDSIESLETVISMYNDLTTEEKAGITDATKLSEIKVVYTTKLIDSISEKITMASKSSIEAAEKQYGLLTLVEQDRITNYAKLTSARTVLDEILASAQSLLLNSTDTNPYFTIGGPFADKKVTINDVYYAKALKMNSKGIITFTSEGTKTLHIIFMGTSLKIDGEEVFPDGNIISISIDEGTHTLLRGDGEGFIFYISVA